MTKELEGLVVDARLLALTVKESSSKLDEMLKRASTISGKLTCTKEYQRDVEKLLVANNKLERRRALLDELQRENRMIKSYEEENSMLRDQLEKSYATLDEIVSRHRQIMHRVSTDRTFCHLSPDMLQQICDTAFTCDVSTRTAQIEQAERLMDVMRYCESVAQRDTELFARIVRENRNLRELLNYAAISDPKIIGHFRQSMQEYDKDQKSRARSRKRRENGTGKEGEGDSEEEEEEEGEEEGETSVLFNRTTLSQSTVGNATMRLAPAAAAAATAKQPALIVDDLSARVGDILTGIDELPGEEESAEESDAETIFEWREEEEQRCGEKQEEEGAMTSSHHAIVNGHKEQLHEQEELFLQQLLQPVEAVVAAPADAAAGDDGAPELLAVSSPPPAKKETDTDSGTASSLSSSPASSSSSDGDSADSNHQ